MCVATSFYQRPASRVYYFAFFNLRNLLYLIKPGTNVDMLVHQIFDTMLAFATRVLNGEMENSEATTQWTFEQIYSFVVPNVRAEVLGEEGKEEAI